MNFVKIILIFCLAGNSLLAQNESIEDSSKLIQSAVAAGIPTGEIKEEQKFSENSSQVDAIISYAKRFLGTPYVYAGTTPSGFDCSGFIYYVMGSFGMDVTRTSYGLAELGETVTLANIRPGDLMFFKGRNVNSTQVGHVGMVIEVTADAIRFIHASSSRGVVIDNFKTSKYYIPRYIKAKRFDYGETDQ